MENLRNTVLSVIVPVYNTEKYLNKCIDSIINQTYKNLEIIIVDDGSTDGSKAICEEYQKLDKRVRVIHQENKGLLATRCVGVEKASGEYVTFVDSDDWIEMEMYGHLMQAFKDNSVDIVVSGMYRYWEENEIGLDFPHLEEGIYEKADIEKKIIPIMLWNDKWGCQGLDPSLCSKVFRKGLIQKYLQNARYLQIYLSEDASVFYPLVLEARSLTIVQKCFYYHRQRKEGEIASYITDNLFFEKLFSVYMYLKKVFLDSMYAEGLLKQLEYFYMRFIQLRRGRYVQERETRKFLFPHEEIPEGSRVILYGAGEVGKIYKQQNDKYGFCNIVLWVDKRGEMCSREMVKFPKAILKCEYDYILIAVYTPELAEQIREELIYMGVKREVIIWANAVIHKLTF